MAQRILIRGARIVDPANGVDRTGDLLVRGGKIAAVGDGLRAAADLVLEAEGLCALPGLVDMHVHLRDPGQTHKEDVFSGCQAAAAGGVTAVAAMPNTAPPVDSADTLRAIAQKAEEADARVYQIACVTKGMSGGALCDFDALRAAGAAGFSDDGKPVPDADKMLCAMRAAARLGVPVLSHCEDLSLAKDGIIHEGTASAALGVPGIPAAAEDVMVAREIALAAASGLPVHICHVSTATALAIIRDAKRRSVPVTCETAPHYFWFTEDAVLSRDARFRMNPPLRTEADRAAVIAAIADGTVDAIATDHAPHTLEEKADFLHAPNGVAGLETSFAAAYTALVLPGHITLARLAELMSVQPARILGIPSGTLTEGADADIALIDLAEAWTVDPDRFRGRAKNTPFAGVTLTGRVKATVCRGRLVYRDGVAED